MYRRRQDPELYVGNGTTDNGMRGRGFSTFHIIIVSLFFYIAGYITAYAFVYRPDFNNYKLNINVNNPGHKAETLAESELAVSSQKEEIERLKKSLHETSVIKKTPEEEKRIIEDKDIMKMNEDKDDQFNERLDKLSQQDIEYVEQDSVQSHSTPIKIFPILPESSVWCEGSKRQNRICRFRNLCYQPKENVWFILKTKRTVQENVPLENRYENALLETSSVTNHSIFYWDYIEVNPYLQSMKNIKVRYEESLHFLFRRLHPRNIMHNLHDDVLNAFFLIKEHSGGGSFENNEPFSLNHTILLLDQYEATDSTPPFTYLSKNPIKFSTYLKKDSDVVTCFRDAVVGQKKTTAWYQYGFRKPQGPIEEKTPNGYLVREVVEWFLRRLNLPLGYDEEYSTLPNLPPPQPDNSHLDFSETNLIVILSRTRNRLILNEEHLKNELTSAFGMETVFVRNEDHSFEEQIKILRKARIVIGMHGSILVMAMFCRRGTVLIEMFPFAVPADHYTPYKTMSNLDGVDLIYRSWENKHENLSVAHPERHQLHGGIGHLSEEMKLKVINTHTVPQHLCCTSPYWLYRIYQDTTVTSSEIITIIKEALFESRQNLKKIRESSETLRESSSFLPPLLDKVDCIKHSQRPKGALWASWDMPWTGVMIETWGILIQNTGKEFVTLGNHTSVTIDGFMDKETVYFFIRAKAEGKWHQWGTRMECEV